MFGFEGEHMKKSYKRLWKLLIDRDNTDILLKIRNALECDLQDIIELTEH